MVAVASKFRLPAILADHSFPFKPALKRFAVTNARLGGNICAIAKS